MHSSIVQWTKPWSVIAHKPSHNSYFSDMDPCCISITNKEIYLKTAVYDQNIVIFKRAFIKRSFLRTDKTSNYCEIAATQ